MAEERTAQVLPIEEINQLTKTLVDTMADGTPKEIAKGLESQFVDRSENSYPVFPSLFLTALPVLA